MIWGYPHFRKPLYVHRYVFAAEISVNDMCKYVMMIQHLEPCILNQGIMSGLRIAS